MIIDSLSNSASVEGLHPLFKKAFDYLKSADFSGKGLGKVILDGDNLYLSISEVNGKTREEAAIETHNRYIDIQMPLTVAETIGWKSAKTLRDISSPYNSEKDIAFYADEPTSYIRVLPGEFVILFPQDGHAPCIGEGAFRKVVVKVRI